MPTTEIRDEHLLERHKGSNMYGERPDLERWLAIRNFLLSRWRRVLGWTLAGTIAAGLFTFQYCKYEAETQLMPPDSSNLGGLVSLALPGLVKAPGLAGLSGLASDALGTKSTGALFGKVLTSRTVLDNLITKYDLHKKYGKEYSEDIRRILIKSTQISEDKKSGVITITVRDSDPQFAANLANAYVQELDHVMLQTATSAARREREFIELRLQEEKKVLDDFEDRFSRFASSSMAFDIPQQTRVMVEASARLEGELIAARAELESLEQIYTSENIRVRSAQAKINGLQRALNKLNAGRGSRASGTSTTASPSLKNLPLVGKEWTDLYRNTRIHETVYEMLTQQYEVARIQEAREIPAVKVLDTPVRPEKRHPGPKLVIAIGMALSLLLACCGQILLYHWQSMDVNDPRRRFLIAFFRI